MIKRRINKRESTKYIVIAFEDKCIAPEYLNKLIKYYLNDSLRARTKDGVKLQFKVIKKNNNKSDPTHIYENTYKALEKQAGICKDDIEKLFIVLDSEEVNNQNRIAKIEKLKERLGDNEIIVAMKPCFEHFLLLHYEDTSREFENCKQVIASLKKYCPDYQKIKEFNVKIFFEKDKLSQAIANSKKYNLDIVKMIEFIKNINK